jgi:two-component system, chemotaxis family, CheB/CheR fusion protein
VASDDARHEQGSPTAAGGGADAGGTDAVGTDAVGTDAVGTDAVGTDAIEPVADERRPAAVVAIGASAGGLAAIKRLLAATPGDAGLAIVVVVHLSPDHESHLVDLLQPHAHMPVVQIAATTTLERDHVYVIPPNANVSSVDTHLRLSALESDRRERAPIDHFFRTLAQTHDGHSIGIVLTGTGSDGTLGLRRIKERGGLTIAQDPNEAEYDGMPQAAIASGMVDLVLGVDEIPKAIVHFARTDPADLVGADDPVAQERRLAQLLALIRTRTGRDFGRYKRSTLLRRLARRMQVHQRERLDDYLDLVRRNPLELETLADEFLVTVTEFFRDPDVFSELERTVLPRLFEEKGPEDAVRVWSVGCASGEEAYSLAILLLERAATLEAPPSLQVFASDLHEASLRRARDGVYPETIEAVVDEGRLRRYFVREHGTFRIRKEVREKILFTSHNVLADAPFSRLDLIVCRNLLIYLDRSVQRDVIDLFHYALRPGGYLLLGPAEGIEPDGSFTVERKAVSLFRKRPGGGARGLPLALPALAPAPRVGSLPGPAPRPRHAASFADVHHEMLDRLGPPSLLVGGDNSLLHLSQRAGDYLYHPGGGPTDDALKLLREEFRLEFRGALHAARTSNAPVRSAPVAFERDGVRRRVVLDIRPARDPRHAGVLLVLFDEATWSSDATAGSVDAGEGTAADVIASLENDLEATRDRLRAIVEETESNNEEMRASNEELQSMNEELRSAMEELETSKEELQSVNEELITVNEENRHKVAELAQLGNDLQTLMSATEIATLFLDRDLRILRFTPRVAALFNVRHSDRGRPLRDLTHRFGGHDLAHDAESVLRRLVPVERELDSDDGGSYLTRIHPYRTVDDRIDGVVVTFVDITQHKAAERHVREVNARLEELVAQRTTELRHANEELETFNYSVSHDLRAPLRGVQRFGRAVLDQHAGGLDDEGRDLLRQLLAAARRMGDQIDGLLELTSVGRSEVRREAVDVGALAEDLAHELQVRDPERRVDVAIDANVVVQGDRRLLRIALGNLLSNAWKFTRDARDARIAVGARREADASVVEVRDNGVGFDARHARHLFDPFHRLPTAAAFEGTGIGLALVRRIAERHGGSVDATAEVGGGATFALRLPDGAPYP